MFDIINDIIKVQYLGCSLIQLGTLSTFDYDQMLEYT